MRPMLGHTNGQVDHQCNLMMFGISMVTNIMAIVLFIILSGVRQSTPSQLVMQFIIDPQFRYDQENEEKSKYEATCISIECFHNNQITINF